MMTKTCGGCLLSCRWRIDVGLMPDHARETLVGVLVGESQGFSGVLESFHKVSLGSSSSRHCNRVCPNTRLRRIVAVTCIVSKHLKELVGS